MYRLENPVRDHAWGSRAHVPRLIGSDPAGELLAENVDGALTSAPSCLDDARTLLEAIQADPSAMLGERVNRAFEGRLPSSVERQSVRVYAAVA